MKTFLLLQNKFKHQNLWTTVEIIDEKTIKNSSLQRYFKLCMHLPLLFIMVTACICNGFLIYNLNSGSQVLCQDWFSNNRTLQSTYYIPHYSIILTLFDLMKLNLQQTLHQCSNTAITNQSSCHTSVPCNEILIANANNINGLFKSIFHFVSNVRHASWSIYVCKFVHLNSLKLFSTCKYNPLTVIFNDATDGLKKTQDIIKTLENL